MLPAPVPSVDLDARDRERPLGVVVLDGRRAAPVRPELRGRGGGQVDVEVLRALRQQVTLHLDRDRPARLPGRDRQRARDTGVVGRRRRRAVSGRVADLDRRLGRARERHDEVSVLLAVVPFRQLRIGDRGHGRCGVVVGDRRRPAPIATKLGAARARQVDVECLDARRARALGDRVALHLDLNRAAGLARRDRQRPGRGGVVRRRRRRAVRRRPRDLHVGRRVARQRDREVRVDLTAVAFGDGDVADRDRLRCVVVGDRRRAAPVGGEQRAADARHVDVEVLGSAFGNDVPVHLDLDRAARLARPRWSACRWRRHSLLTPPSPTRRSSSTRPERSREPHSTGSPGSSR